MEILYSLRTIKDLRKLTLQKREWKLLLKSKITLMIVFILFFRKFNQKISNGIFSITNKRNRSSIGSRTYHTK